VRVLSVGSTRSRPRPSPLNSRSGHKVIFTIRPPFNIDKELAEKAFDAIILSVPAMDNHDKAGDLVPMSRVALARVGVGVVVKEGQPLLPPCGSAPRTTALGGERLAPVGTLKDHGIGLEFRSCALAVIERHHQ